MYINYIVGIIHFITDHRPSSTEDILNRLLEFEVYIIEQGTRIYRKEFPNRYLIGRREEFVGIHYFPHYNLMLSLITFLLVSTNYM